MGNFCNDISITTILTCFIVGLQDFQTRCETRFSCCVFSRQSVDACAGKLLIRSLGSHSRLDSVNYWAEFGSRTLQDPRAACSGICVALCLRHIFRMHSASKPLISEQSGS